MGFRLVPKSVILNDQVSKTDALLLLAVAELLVSVVALKTQAANAANRFTPKIKQIKRSDMVTYFYLLFTIITEATQIFEPGH